MKRKIETQDFTVEFDDTQELRDKVFERIVAFYVQHNAFSGECIMQSDNPIIYGPVLLGEIADEEFKFDVQWKEEY